MAITDAEFLKNYLRVSNILRFFNRRATARDRFDALLRPHLELLYRMAYRWTGNQDQAEDLLQDVLVRLVDRLKEMEQVESLRPWLIRILYNRYVDDYRRQRRSPIDTRYSGWDPDISEDEPAQEDPLAQAPDPERPSEREDQCRQLHQALSQLEPEQRDLVLLHDLEGYTAEEAAAILAIPLGTVKSRLHRARARLKQLLFEDSG